MVRTRSPGSAMRAMSSDSGGKRGSIDDSRAIDGFDQPGSVDACDRHFAGGVNVEHPDRIRLVKAVEKLRQQVAGAGISMRLEQNQNATEAALARRLESGADFRRVVAVVIHDRNVAHDSPLLEPAFDPAKLRQTGGNLLGRYRKLGADGDGGGGVPQVVQSGYGKRERPERIALAVDQKSGLPANGRQNFQPECRIGERVRR